MWKVFYKDLSNLPKVVLLVVDEVGVTELQGLRTSTVSYKASWVELQEIQSQHCGVTAVMNLSIFLYLVWTTLVWAFC